MSVNTRSSIAVGAASERAAVTNASDIAGGAVSSAAAVRAVYRTESVV